MKYEEFVSRLGYVIALLGLASILILTRWIIINH